MLTFPKKYADTVAKLRVPSGFLLCAGFGWLAAPSWESLMAGVPLSMAGVALRAWAAGNLAKNQNLAMNGPYAWIRNPLYAGTLLVAAGVVISAQRWELVALFAAVFGLVYLPVIQLEEQHLAKLFPNFADYCRRVPLLIPYKGKAPNRSSGPSGFQWALYRKNEEYNALLGYLAGAAWLTWRAAMSSH